MTPRAARRLSAVAPRRSKFGNVRTEVDGITFDSKAEAKRYQDLRLLQRAGEIFDLRRQVTYPFVIAGVDVGSYRADFTYLDKHGLPVTEDVKGVSTPVFKFKAKLFRALYGRDIIIVRA